MLQDDLENKAKVSTVESIGMDMLQQVFGNTAIAPFLPQLINMAKQHLGITNDTLLDQVIFSNKTPTGVYEEILNKRINSNASVSLGRLRNALRDSWLTDISKTLTPFDTWVQTADKSIARSELPKAYNDYIQNQVRGWSSNPLWNMAYQMLDPDKLNEASEYLQQAGANSIRHGQRAGRRGSILQARAVGQLFMKDGTVDFDKKDYGHMGIDEASAVAAALTRDIDVFESSGVNIDKIKKATERLKNMVKDYTKALSPLKDVFGNDVPAMIKAVEDLSGKKFSSLSPSNMAGVVTKVMSGVAANNYTLGQVQAARKELATAIRGMNVPFIQDIGATAQGQLLLDTTVAGMAPAFMSEERYNNWASDMVLRASNSTGAGALNKAYALWQERKGGQGTFEEFKKEYNTLRDTKGANAAILEIAKVSSNYELNREAHKSQYYSDAVTNNYGGQMAVKENVDSAVRVARQRSDNKRAYDLAVKAIRKDASILGSEEALKKAGLDTETMGEVRAINQGYYGQQLPALLVAQDNAVKAEKRTNKQITLRKSLDTLGATFNTDAKELIRNYLHASPGTSIKDILSQSKWLQAADPAVQETVKYELMAAKEMAEEAGITDAQEKEDFIQERLKYALTASDTNAFRQEYLQKYEGATKQLDRIDNLKNKKIKVSQPSMSKWKDYRLAKDERDSALGDLETLERKLATLDDDADKDVRKQLKRDISKKKKELRPLERKVRRLQSTHDKVQRKLEKGLGGESGVEDWVSENPDSLDYNGLYNKKELQKERKHSMRMEHIATYANEDMLNDYIKATPGKEKEREQRLIKMWDSIKAPTLEERGMELEDMLRADSFKGELKTRRLDNRVFEQELVNRVKTAAVEQGYLSEQQVMSIRDELKEEDKFRTAVSEQDLERVGTAIHSTWQKDQSPQNIVSGDTAGLLRDVLVKLKEVLEKDSKRDTVRGFLPVMKDSI